MLLRLRLGIVRSVACYGALHHDVKARPLVDLRRGTSNPVTTTRGLGGVACNVARSLARLGVPVHLVSVVGDDGAPLLREVSLEGVEASAVSVRPGVASASYTAVLDGAGGLDTGIADMEVYEAMGADWVGQHAVDADIWFADANLPASGVRQLIRLAGDRPLFVDPVSVEKSARVADAIAHASAVFPDAAEARALTGEATPEDAAEALVSMGAERALVTIGREGVCAADARGVVRHDAMPVATVLDVTGAGDAFAAGYIAAVAGDDGDPVAWGLAAASLAVETLETVPSSLSRQRLLERLGEARRAG